MLFTPINPLPTSNPRFDKTDLSKLEYLCHKHLKTWVEIPRCATNAIFYHENSLNIKSISELYKETHTPNYIDIKLKGDKVVNYALEDKVERETNFKIKNSILVQAKQIFLDAVRETELDTNMDTNSNTNFRKKVKNQAKDHLRKENH